MGALLKYGRAFARAFWYLSILVYMSGVIVAIKSILDNFIGFINQSYDGLSSAISASGLGGSTAGDCTLYWFHLMGLDTFLTNALASFVALGVFWGTSIIFFVSMKVYLRISTFAGKALLG